MIMAADDRHPALTVAAWAATTAPGRVVTVLAVLGLLAVFSQHARRALAPLWRFTVGFPILWAPGPWDSKWDRPAPPRPLDRVGFAGEHYPRTRWGKRPGYQRMLIRWAVIAWGIALWHHPWPIMLGTAAVLLVVVVARLARAVIRWGLRRAAGLFAEAAVPLLGYRDRDLAEWIAMPRPRLTWLPIPVDPRVLRLARRVSDRLEHVLGRLAVPSLRVPLDADDTRVRVRLNVGEIRQEAIDAVKKLAVARIENGPWEAVHYERELVIELKHPKRPPTSVWYDAEANQRFAVDDVPIGQRAGGEWVTLPLRAKTPHGICSASTGWGKTTTANVYAAHTAGNGGRVFIQDPKRIGFLRTFGGLDQVTIRSTVEGWVKVVEEFHVEMNRRYELIERFPQIEDDPMAYFQPWFLVTDERGSYVSEIRAWWKEHGQKGIPAPPLRQEKLNLWQARAAAMYMFDLAQQANLDVFLDSDGRDQRMFRIAAGPQTRSSWMMLFRGVAKASAVMRKGRAILGIGPDHTEEIQLAQVSPEDARTFAAAGAAIAEHENAEREKRLAELLRGSVPASGYVSTPAPMVAAVPGQPTPGQTLANGSSTIVAVAEKDEANDTEYAQESTKKAVSGDDLIVGLQAAADFLGMSLAAFEKARDRRPIDAEVRSGTRPAWPSLALREWRAQAPRAGHPRPDASE